jgi:predicted phage terminase large subunit-like protein
MIPSLEDVKRERARRSLAEFVKQAWPVLEPGTKLAWNWHLDAICAHLEAVSRGEITRLLINVPPGHMKSLLVAVFWPAWQWLHNPQWRSLFATYAKELSIRDSVRCRDLIQSPWYREFFQPQWELSGDQNVKGYFANTETGFRLSLSVGGQGTGFRGDVVVFDDPMNVDEHPSQEKLASIASWWDMRMTSRLNDLETGAFVGIMQRVHEADLAGHLLEKGGEKWEHLCLPSEYDPGRRGKTSIFADPRKKRGELLFPAKFPRKVIEQAKIDLGDQYDAQHQQTPSAQGGGIFKRHQWRFWYPDDVTAPPPVRTDVDGEVFLHSQKPLPKIHTFAQSWDLAFKGNASSDFVAGQLWGMGNGEYFLIDQVHDRLSFVETVEEFEAFCEKYPLTGTKYVEDKANGPALISTLKSRIGGIEPVNPEGGKEARAHACTPLIKAGKVYLPHPAFFPWVNSFLNELTKFPKSKHDDRTDALTQALNKLKSDAGNMLHALTKGAR